MQQVREKVHQQEFDSALARVEQRLAESPSDWEAHGWHARLLAWMGRWAEAETEYRMVLKHAADDTDVLGGLADVLIWQGRAGEALPLLNRARALAGNDPGILLRRAEALRLSGDLHAARQQLRELLLVDPANLRAKQGLEALDEPRHQLRIGTDIDTFNYTSAAQAQAALLSSRWSQRWSSQVGVSSYQRFRQNAAKFLVGTTFRLSARDWLDASAAVGHDEGIIPRREAYLEYGHSFRLSGHHLTGFEVDYQQRWLWYRGAHVLTIGASQTYYFPRDWSWRLTLNGARSGFTGSDVEWVPSGSTRLLFPLYRGLSGQLAFAVGTENFAQVDQIGRFAARTYAGVLRYRFTRRQDISGYVAHQDRSLGRSQASYGLSYGIRF